MNDNLIVKSSPHINDKASTRKIMLNVIVSLLPCIVASVVLFGIRTLRIISVCAVFCLLAEIVASLLSRKRVLIEDFSAVLTGILLALNLPVGISYHACFIGSVSAIVVAKQLFGGIGQNFVNPALFGRAIMLTCFPSEMTNWSTNKGAVDLINGATPLELVAAGRSAEIPDVKELFFGLRGGCIGETCIFAILIGLIYLICAKIINPIIPLSFIGSALAFTLILGGSYTEVLCGGIFFAAVFMATDYVTSPISNLGKLVFGISCGVLTVILRKFAAAPEGVSYAVLFMNLLVPYINRFSLAKPFGTDKKAVQNV